MTRGTRRSDLGSQVQHQDGGSCPSFGTEEERPARGRAMSPELSDHLVDVAVDILADEGWDGFTADNLSRRASAGKAGIYRRWPNMRALAREVLDRSLLITSPEDTGSLQGDLWAFLQPWRADLSQAEKAAASLIGVARHDADIRAGLEQALVRPLAVAVREIADREAQRRQAGAAGGNELVIAVLQALWVQRYSAVRGAGMSADEIQRLIDDVVLPTLDCG